MLHEFLLKNEKEILDMTEGKTRDLAGAGPTSEQLKQGLPIFYKQLVNVLGIEKKPLSESEIDKAAMSKAARESNEPAMAQASGRLDEVELARSAGLHGVELLRLGYTLSHVVHAYGAMCQSITELATNKNAFITTNEFRNLNQCLDVAIAGAVTEYESLRDTAASRLEVEHLGFLAHELRNALSSVTISHQLIKNGTVAAGGSTNQVLERGLKRIDELIDRALTEVRLRVEPEVHTEPCHLLQLVDQIILIAKIESQERNQTLNIAVDPDLIIEVDQQLIHSALSNVIQNALKFTRAGGTVQVRGSSAPEQVIVEVEDECGGLPDGGIDLFKTFKQMGDNRKGLGLGLTIARRAIALNHGTIEVRDLPGKGCIFKIALPKALEDGLPVTLAPKLEHRDLPVKRLAV